jgi:hypothetical protein
MRETLNKAEDGSYNEEDEGHAWPLQPSGVAGTNVCSTTGVLPSGSEEDPGCPTRFEYFLSGNFPESVEGGNQDIQIDKTTSTLANPDTPPENIETQNHPVIYDPLGTLVCLDCLIPEKPVTIRYPLSY